MLGKKITISYEEVRSRYENFRSRCSDKNNKSKNNNKSINFKCKNSKKCKKLCKCLSNNKTVKKEKGCTNPINGVKSKCLIRIVPLKVRKKHLIWIQNVKLLFLNSNYFFFFFLIFYFFSFSY